MSESELFWVELTTNGAIGGLMLAVINYAIDRFVVLRKKLADCKTGVKVGMFVSSWVLFALWIALHNVAEVEMLGETTSLATFIIGIVLTILGTIAATKIWNRDEKVLTLNQRIYMGLFNSLFLIPYWLFSKKD